MIDAVRPNTEPSSVQCEIRHERLVIRLVGEIDISVWPQLDEVYGVLPVVMVGVAEQPAGAASDRRRRLRCRVRGRQNIGATSHRSDDQRFETAFAGVGLHGLYTISIRDSPPSSASTMLGHTTANLSRSSARRTLPYLIQTAGGPPACSRDLTAKSSSFVTMTAEL